MSKSLNVAIFNGSLHYFQRNHTTLKIPINLNITFCYMLLLSEPFFISTVENALKFICFSGGLGIVYLHNFREWM